jgi:hypothetical protein
MGGPETGGNRRIIAPRIYTYMMHISQQNDHFHEAVGAPWRRAGEGMPDKEPPLTPVLGTSIKRDIC